MSTSLRTPSAFYSKKIYAVVSAIVSKWAETGPEMTVSSSTKDLGLVWMAPWPELACQAINLSPRRPKSNTGGRCLASELLGRQHPNSPLATAMALAWMCIWMPVRYRIKGREGWIAGRCWRPVALGNRDNKSMERGDLSGSKPSSQGATEVWAAASATHSVGALPPETWAKQKGRCHVHGHSIRVTAIKWEWV